VWFTAEERDVLCQQAELRWGQSQELRARSTAARMRAQLLHERTSAAIGRAEDLLQRQTGIVIGEAELLGEDSRHAAALERLADRAIADWGSAAMALDDGAAVVACGEMGDLLRIKEVLGATLSSVFGATDAGTALGLAIAIQPDVAVIDTKLELADGVDVALALPLYAPRTKTLVLTEDPLRAAQVRVVGFDAAPRHPPDSVLGEWVVNAPA